jgi:hypothetical protein
MVPLVVGSRFAWLVQGNNGKYRFGFRVPAAWDVFQVRVRYGCVWVFGGVNEETMWSLHLGHLLAIYSLCSWNPPVEQVGLLTILPSHRRKTRTGAS